jgi:uncharacterized protein YacL
VTEPGRAYTPQNEPASRRPGRGWSIAGLVCGIIAFLIVPILFGPLGVIFGFLGYRGGDRRLGVTAMVVSVVGLVVGLIVGALLLVLFGGQLPRQ